MRGTPEHIHWRVAADSWLLFYSAIESAWQPWRSLCFIRSTLMFSQKLVKRLDFPSPGNSYLLLCFRPFLFVVLENEGNVGILSGLSSYGLGLSPVEGLTQFCLLGCCIWISWMGFPYFSWQPNGDVVNILLLFVFKYFGIRLIDKNGEMKRNNWMLRSFVGSATVEIVYWSLPIGLVNWSF